MDQNLGKRCGMTVSPHLSGQLAPTGRPYASPGHRPGYGFPSPDAKPQLAPTGGPMPAQATGLGYGFPSPDAKPQRGGPCQPRPLAWVTVSLPRRQAPTGRSYASLGHRPGLLNGAALCQGYGYFPARPSSIFSASFSSRQNSASKSFAGVGGW